MSISGFLRQSREWNRDYNRRIAETETDESEYRIRIASQLCGPAAARRFCVAAAEEALRTLENPDPAWRNGLGNCRAARENRVPNRVWHDAVALAHAVAVGGASADLLPAARLLCIGDDRLPPADKKYIDAAIGWGSPIHAMAYIARRAVLAALADDPVAGAIDAVRSMQEMKTATACLVSGPPTGVSEAMFADFAAWDARELFAGIVAEATA